MCDQQCGCKWVIQFCLSHSPLLAYSILPRTSNKLTALTKFSDKNVNCNINLHLFSVEVMLLDSTVLFKMVSCAMPLMLMIVQYF